VKLYGKYGRMASGILKIWKKGNLKSEKTWKIQKKSKLNSEKDMKKD
jgi:hypothetical protein